MLAVTFHFFHDQIRGNLSSSFYYSKISWCAYLLKLLMLIVYAFQSSSCRNCPFNYGGDIEASTTNGYALANNPGTTKTQDHIFNQLSNCPDDEFVTTYHGINLTFEFAFKNVQQTKTSIVLYILVTLHIYDFNKISYKLLYSSLFSATAFYTAA